MQEPIRAFVGHSFAPEDANLVAVILKYLSGIASINPNFSWEHAENPEPEVVDVKVLGLLADKNTFIGICTKKEKVVQPASLRKPFFFSNLLGASPQDFVWKTSDWIIQEIGLAVGRELKVILLLENGVKPPGALQGNLEYIPLDREAPEKSFDRLLAMISSLAPKATQLVEVSTLGRSSETSASIESTANPDTPEWLHPTLDWRWADYKKAAWYLVLMGNEVELQSLTDAFLKLPEGQPGASKIQYHGYVEHLKIVYSGKGDLVKLERMGLDANQAPIFEYLGVCYEHFSEFIKAADAYEKAVALTDTGTMRIKLLGKMALSLEKAGLSHKAQAVENQMRNVVFTEGSELEQFLKAERDLAKHRNDDEILIAAMEHLLELNPSDIETRFALAYKYSNIGQQELALMHYLRIPYSSRDGNAWNNLGVCFDNFGMPISSIAAYRQSEAKGETLAISNLAVKLLNAGFSSEAKDLLEKGLLIKDHHKNIDANFAKLKGASEAETIIESATIKKAQPASDFYRQFGRSIALPLPEPLAGIWKGPNCNLVLTTHGRDFLALGDYEVKNALGLIASSLRIGATPIESTKFSVAYRGLIHGRGVVGSLTSKNMSDTAPTRPISLLNSSPPPTVVMWLSDDSNELHVLERSAGVDAKRYSLYRVAASELST